ncbi:hypothetical protein ACFX13_033107 [Malus domestica]
MGIHSHNFYNKGLEISLPLHEFGLPEGCKNTDAVPSRNLFWNFFGAVAKLQQPVERLLETLKPNPSCILGDKYLAWTAYTAKKFATPRHLFDGTSCFTLLCNHNILESKVLDRISGLEEPFLVPGLRDEIELTPSQLPGHLNAASQGFRSLYQEIEESEKGAFGVVVNTFEELESEYVKEYRKVGGAKVCSIGPVSLSNATDLDKAQRGNTASLDENKCLMWLN